MNDISKLEELRTEKGFTQEYIADKAGIAVSTYSQYENGLRSVPAETAKLIAGVMNCSVEEIFLPKKFTVSKNDA